MKFYSTRHQSPETDWNTALMQGLPDDNGLYMPESIKPLPKTFWDNADQYSFEELAFEVAKCLLQDAVPHDDLRQIVERATGIDVPIVPLTEHIACLELFHGPSFAFKDFGARFMAQMMAYSIANEDNPPTCHILTATSGDTGGAVAQGFLGAPNIKVIILYPSGKISDIQEKQLTTLQSNITAVEIDGTFDNCQQLVKQAFLDAELRKHKLLSSANSINLARLIPQTFYYVWAYARNLKSGKPLLVSVPSGNFGNLCAGLIAKRIGMPVARFIAANNANDVFTQYHKTGNFQPKSSVKTLSNAMDVGNPSNLQRIQDLYKHDLNLIRDDIAAYSFDDQQTLHAIQEVYDKHQYIVCPHTAVAYLGLTTYMEQHPQHQNAQGLFLGTAHPVKFYDMVEPALQIKIPIPQQLQQLMDRPKESIPMKPNFDTFKDFLMNF